MGNFVCFSLACIGLPKYPDKKQRNYEVHPYKDYTICFVSHKHFFSHFEIVMMIMIMMG